MKKIAMVLIGIMFISSMCYAHEEGATVTSQVTAAVKKAGTAVGKVVSVTVADPAQGIMKGGVEIVDDMGKTVNYTADSTTKVVDGALNVVTLGQLKKDEAVKVEYTETEEGAKAESISVVK